MKMEPIVEFDASVEILISDVKIITSMTMKK